MNNHYIITNGQKIIIDSKKGMNPAFNPVFSPSKNYNCCYSEQVEELILPICR